MLQTIEAIIDEKGTLRFLAPIQLPKKRRAIVTILDEEPNEEALATDWLRPEEDEAGSHLAQLPSL